MGRTVSAAVTWGEDYLGTIGPVAVSIPWWSEVEPVVAHLRDVLGVPVIVLRLLRVDGGDGSRDGHVTYHAAALSRPAPGQLAARPASAPPEVLPPAKRPAAARAWIAAWSSSVPGCDPARALRITEPLCHRAYAVRYQEFLDGMEPSEQIYHRGDPAAAIRAALRSAPGG
jgi:hypothetical protein